jgi:hypothetical protein
VCHQTTRPYWLALSCKHARLRLMNTLSGSEHFTTARAEKKRKEIKTSNIEVLFR